MKRFSHVQYDESASTALVGAGLVWDDVYDALDALDVSVVGGRASGVRLPPTTPESWPQLISVFAGWGCWFYPRRW